VRLCLIAAGAFALAVILMRGPWAGAAIAVLRGLGAEGSTMPQDLTQGEVEYVAALERTNAALQRTTWQLKRVTSQLKACVRLAASNTEGFQQVCDELETLFPRERPALRVVKGDDDA
jgi:hypothetical protein